MDHDIVNSEETISRIPEYNTGVLPASRLYMHMPSEHAKKLLYYAPHIGHFYVTDKYRINRAGYDYYLMMLVESGSMEIEVAEQTFTARQHDIILLDTRSPHAYRALEKGSFRFFHFDGNQSEALFRILTQRNTHCFRPKNVIPIESAFIKIITLGYDGLTNEFMISAQIHSILCELITQSLADQEQQHVPVSQAISYLDHHFTEEISVEELAAQVGLSPYHFSRLFRQYTGTSPHAYIVDLRVTLAKDSLSKTTDSIDSISEACGFNSPQYFVRCFKQHVGCSPRQYRKQTIRETMLKNDME